MWKKNGWSIFLVPALLFTMPVIGFGQDQDRVGDLEKKIQSLESQLNELKTMLKEQQETQKAVPAAPETPAAPEQTKLIGPGGTLQVGGDIRFRGLYFDNLWDFNSSSDGDQREVFRFRPRVFLDWKPTDDIETYVRFTKEWFYGQDKELPGYDVEAKDAMFDNAWGEWKNILDSGVSVKLGRQDLIYGDGFVLLDGTPWDGSQTISFDAAKLTWAHNWGSTDLIYSKLQEGDFQNTDDEDLYGIYNKFKIEPFGLEPYLLYRNKNLKANQGVVAGVSFDPSPKESTLLLGMRTTATFDLTDGMKLALAAEGGKEWGDMDFSGSGALPAGQQFSRFAGDNTVDRDAWGGQFSGTLSFTDVTWKPSLKAGVSYMSGDDPGTADYEGWDDFYSQWPKYSELYIYSIYDGFKGRNGANDPDLGAWANMIIPEFMITVQPTEKLTQSFRYLYFLADEDNGPGGGDERGHNLQWLTNYVFTKNLSGHFLFEWFDPGNYYLDSADEAIFTRFQIMYTF